MTTNSSAAPTVLVTGAGGFIALHAIRALLAQGYRVRGALRDPARGGDLRAARAANVARVVLLSSTAAVVSGHEHVNKTFDESDWSRVDGDVGAYAKSKTLAERAAWDFVQGPENRPAH
jgi:dihydroflavonol-4-reductase